MTIKKMQVLRLKPIIDRVHRDSEPLQFLRELVTNSEEAGATRVKVGVDHHTGNTRGIWRLVVWDDGRGMTGGEMQEYLNFFGSGGKSIGGAHENFGIGSKTSILPRNRAGMVVCSWTSACPEGSMIKLKLDEDEDEYGMHVWESGEVVTTPHDDGEVDWGALRQDWMKTGTMVVLLGNTGTESTYLGICGTQTEPALEHSSVWWAIQYLSYRYWSFSQGLSVSVWGFYSSPSRGKKANAKGTYRAVTGARAWAEKLAVAKGSIDLPDGTKVWWYLKDKQAGMSYHGAGFRSGGVAALYKRELYHIQTHHNSLKKFGLTGKTRSKAVLIFEPVPLADGEGASPGAARSSLKMHSATTAIGTDLPWDKWAEWWRDSLPEALTQSMIKDQEAKNIELDPQWGDRIMHLFGERWKRPRLRRGRNGGYRPVEEDEPTKPKPNPPRPAPPEPKPPRPTPPKPPPPEDDQLTLVVPGKKKRRTKRQLIPGGLPVVEWVEDGWPLANAVGASYTPPSKAHPSGVVEVNWCHRLFLELHSHHCSFYPEKEYIQEAVKLTIRQVYERHLATNIAHTHHFRDLMDLTDLLDDASLTQSMFGLYAQHEEITKALTALCGSPKVRK